MPRPKSKTQAQRLVAAVRLAADINRGFAITRPEVCRRLDIAARPMDYAQVFWDAFPAKPIDLPLDGLTKHEADIVRVLSRQPGRFYPYDSLAAEALGYPVPHDLLGSLQQHAKNLRLKGIPIQTWRHYGYALDARGL